MRRTAVRVCVALTLLATLLVPAAGSVAGTEDKLDDINAKLEAVQDKIDARAEEREATKEAADAIMADIRELRSILAELESDIARVESQVRSAQARIDHKQEQIEEVEGRATAQAVQLYKSGATDSLDALLTAKSLTDLDDKIEMMGVAAQENTGYLVRFSRLKFEIEAEHERLFALEKELEARHTQQAEVKETLDQQYAQHSEKLAELEDELDDLHDEKGDLEVASSKLERELLASQTIKSVAVLGESSGGYIWPLNGAVTSYYGPRWGRMHTGIDIDGVTGDPIVASRAGRVQIAGPYYGYGNAVVIDHGGGVATLYAHMSAIDVSAGQDVSQGQIVGRVGCTGSCTGDHLHFEVRINGSPDDPMAYLP